MELTVKKTDLVKQLSFGQGVIERKTTIPVLSNVLIEAQEGEILLTLTDLELGIRTSCPAVVSKTGVTTVPARRLLDYVRLLPDAELAVKSLDNDSVSLVCGRSRTRIAGMSSENFPELPQMPGVLTQIPAPLVVNVITKTIFAVASEESRYTLTGHDAHAMKLWLMVGRATMSQQPETRRRPPPNDGGGRLFIRSPSAVGGSPH